MAMDVHRRQPAVHPAGTVDAALAHAIVPQEASWLTPEERDVLDHTLSTEVREQSPVSWLAALKDTRVLILAAIQFGFTLASYGIGIFLPLILKEYHLSNWTIGWMSAIPYLFASAMHDPRGPTMSTKKAGASSISPSHACWAAQA